MEISMRSIAKSGNSNFKSVRNTLRIIRIYNEKIRWRKKFLKIQKII